jgi:hypothetical protein
MQVSMVYSFFECNILKDHLQKQGRISMLLQPDHSVNMRLTRKFFKLNYGGVSEITPEFIAIVQSSPDAKSTDFGHERMSISTSV